MAASTAILLIYLGVVLAYFALILWEVKRGRAKWYLIFVGVAVAGILAAVLFPVYVNYSGRENFDRWNREHPNSARPHYE